MELWILARTRPSGNHAILQVFYVIRCGSLSIPYASVLARLQYLSVFAGQT